MTTRRPPHSLRRAGAGKPHDKAFVRPHGKPSGRPGFPRPTVDEFGEPLPSPRILKVGRNEFNEVKVDCQIKALCGGCEFVNSPYPKSLNTKHDRTLKLFQSAELLAHAVVNRPVAAEHPLAYRALAKLAIRPAKPHPEQEPRRFSLGLFKPGSHDIVDIVHCPIHVDSIKKFLKAFSAFVETTTLTPYDESTGQGDLRYLIIRANHISGELMVVVSATRNVVNELKPMFENMRAYGVSFAAVHQQINTTTGNAIFIDAPLTRIIGKDSLRESLCDLQFEISPTAFFQINPDQAEALYQRVDQIVGSAEDRESAWDLYCGIGQLSLLLARSGYDVLGIEENPQAVANAQSNAHRNQLAEKSRFLAGRVEDILPSELREQAPAVIVANPSRRGMDEAARTVIKNALASRATQRFVYVSCEAETLIRDLKDLTSAGLKLRQLDCFDMFPQTDKLEWIAVVTPGVPANR